jgi:hypothetical protein
MNSARLLEYEEDPPPEPAMDELGKLPEQVATLKVDVEYIKRDVSEIKVVLHSMDETLGTLDARVHQNEKSLLSSQKDLTERIDSVDKRLTEKIDGVDKHLIEKFGEIRLWVMGLYVAEAAGLLFVMAKGFK